MHIQRQTPMELVLQDGSRWLALVFLAVALFIAVSSIERHTLKGLLVSAFFLLFAAAFFRHSTFTLDRMQRVARWRRLNILKNEAGFIPFDSIRDIVIDAQGGNRNSVSYRLVIVTADGRTPMANLFEGGSIEHYQMLRQQILDFVGLGSALPAAEPTLLSNDRSASLVEEGIPADLDSSLRALLAQGRTIDAIELLRSRNYLSLVEAKTRVDALVAEIKAGR